MAESTIFLRNVLNIADEWSTFESFKVGDICIRNNTVYRCIVAHPKLDFFEADNFVKTTLGAEITALRRMLS